MCILYILHTNLIFTQELEALSRFIPPFILTHIFNDLTFCYSLWFIHPTSLFRRYLRHSCISPNVLLSLCFIVSLLLFQMRDTFLSLLGNLDVFSNRSGPNQTGNRGSRFFYHEMWSSSQHNTVQIATDRVLYSGTREVKPILLASVVQACPWNPFDSWHAWNKGCTLMQSFPEICLLCTKSSFFFLGRERGWIVCSDYFPSLIINPRRWIRVYE